MGRNLIVVLVKEGVKVALLAEGVGRNLLSRIGTLVGGEVALPAEGVGRNCAHDAIVPLKELSPSSRRAWVEIWTTLSRPSASWVALLAEGVGRNAFNHIQQAVGVIVALLAEGVGRNIASVLVVSVSVTSPSSRRAWVEIVEPFFRFAISVVALLAEGVGRNQAARERGFEGSSRPPRGGRG